MSQRLSKSTFIIVCVSTNILLSFGLSYLAELFNVNSFGLVSFDKWPPLGIFIVSVIIAPLFETLIYQYSVIEGALFILKKRNYANVLAILLSGLLFGVSHPYSISYLAIATIMGWSFAIFYVVAKSRKDISPFLLILVVHMVLNTIAFVINDVLKL